MPLLKKDITLSDCLNNIFVYKFVVEYNIISMHLEDKLTFLQGCLEEKSPKLIGKIPGDCDISGNDVLKTCYYHMKSLDESIQQDSFKILIKKNKEEL